jgi:hypothetical protein
VTLENRVLPDGRIVAIALQGTLTGNRGILHGPDRVLARQSQHIHWIACRLDWQGRRREVMTGRKWTELFFLDEPTSLAAGHRPCAFCRRADYRRWQAAWAVAHGPASANQMDRALQASRRDGRAQRRHRDGNLPDGAMILLEGAPATVWQGAALPWSPAGHGPPLPLPAMAEVLTPAVTVAVLRAGYRPAPPYRA